MVFLRAIPCHNLLPGEGGIIRGGGDSIRVLEGSGKDTGCRKGARSVREGSRKSRVPEGSGFERSWENYGRSWEN